MTFTEVALDETTFVEVAFDEMAGTYKIVMNNIMLTCENIKWV